MPAERWAMLLAPLLIAAVSLPLALELVAPNGMYGYRTTASMASDAAWFRANRAAGITGVIGGLAAAAFVYRLVKRECTEGARTVSLATVLLALVSAIAVAGSIA